MKDREMTMTLHAASTRNTQVMTEKGVKERLKLDWKKLKWTHRRVRLLQVRMGRCAGLPTGWEAECDSV